MKIYLGRKEGRDIKLLLSQIPAGVIPNKKDFVSSFYMGIFAVTQEQWEIVASWKPINRSLIQNPWTFQGFERPIETVNWYEAQEFCARLRRKTNYSFRLPTVQEWEYAARAGSQEDYLYGIDLKGWEAQFEYENSVGITVPVDYFNPNEFGLYNVHGNVWEWCGNEEDSSPYEINSTAYLKGGSWNSKKEFCRFISTISYNKRWSSRAIGFRVCCDIDPIERAALNRYIYAV